jgi:hypothetical protein
MSWRGVTVTSDCNFRDSRGDTIYLHFHGIPSQHVCAQESMRRPVSIRRSGRVVVHPLVDPECRQALCC